MFFVPMFFWVNFWVFKLVIYAFNTYKRFCDKDCPNSLDLKNLNHNISILGSNTYAKFYFNFFFLNSKICLNLFVDDCQLGYITKLKKNWNLAMEIFPFFLFCDVVRLAIIHKKMKKILAIDHNDSRKFEESFYIFASSWRVL